MEIQEGSGTCFMGAFTDDLQLYGHGLVLRTGQSFTGFLGVSLRIWNTVFSFMCFEHCAERCLCPYRRLFCDLEPVRCPTLP
jgi:hypothetical protein